ncbi:MAG: hypothetical protein KF860_13185 [Cyclobacteriaceae bacterium]|nr:hypothetical protein [Cyclobacteriaceae bacterium]
MRLSKRKGNMMIAPMASKIAERVKPRILKGNNSNHNKGKINTASKASGQLTAKSKNQSMSAMSVRIDNRI